MNRYNRYIGWFGQVRLWIGTGYMVLFAVGLLGFVSNDLARLRINPAAHGWQVRAVLSELANKFSSETLD